MSEGYANGGGEVDRAFSYAERIVATRMQAEGVAFEQGRRAGYGEGRAKGYEQGFKAALDMAARSILAINANQMEPGPWVRGATQAVRDRTEEAHRAGGGDTGSGDRTTEGDEVGDRRRGGVADDAVPVASGEGVGTHGMAGVEPVRGELAEIEAAAIGDEEGALAEDDGVMADASPNEGAVGVDAEAEVPADGADGAGSPPVGPAPLFSEGEDADVAKADARRGRYKGEPEVPLDASPFPGLDYGALTKNDLRVFNVVAAQPMHRMAITIVAKESELKPDPAAKSAKRLESLGYVTRSKEGYYKPAEGYQGLVRLKPSFLRNSDEFGATSFQKRHMLYAIAVLGRARPNAIARQAKIKDGSSDIRRNLIELKNQSRIVVDDEGYYGLAPGLFHAEPTGATEAPVEEATFAMVKSGAVARGDAERIVEVARKADLKVVAMRRLMLPHDVAKAIYAEHEGRNHFDRLIDSVTSGEVVIMVLKGLGAVRAWRDLMGGTDPQTAEKGTIRALYGRALPDNATHGSDGPAAAAREIELASRLLTEEDAVH